MPRIDATGGTALTKGDIAVLNIVEVFMRTYGRAPTLRQIAIFRGHRSHGASQRSLRALLSSGRLLRDSQGHIALRDDSLSRPALAQVVDTDPPRWVAAPAAALLALELRTSAHRLGAPATLFFVRDRVRPGQRCLARRESGEHLLHQASATLSKRPDGSLWDLTADGTPVRVIGPLRYYLFEFAG